MAMQNFFIAAGKEFILKYFSCSGSLCVPLVLEKKSSKHIVPDFEN